MTYIATNFYYFIFNHKNYIFQQFFYRRYKMISQFTWPNFRAGSAKDGCRVLIEEKGFQNDVKYGRTKIFIRSPTTLFKLEKVRKMFIIKFCWSKITTFLSRYVEYSVRRSFFNIIFLF